MEPDTQSRNKREGVYAGKLFGKQCRGDWAWAPGRFAKWKRRDANKPEKK